MKQAPANKLEEMHATLVRAIALLESQGIAEAHRLQTQRLHEEHRDRLRQELGLA
jgi:hypothetical protein